MAKQTRVPIVVGMINARAHVQHLAAGTRAVLDGIQPVRNRAKHSERPRTDADGKLVPRRESAAEFAARYSNDPEGNLEKHISTQGFRSLADFMHAVHVAGGKGQTPETWDPRLVANAAPSSFGREAVGEDGGFAVPPEYIAEILSRVFEDSLALRTDLRTLRRGNALILPVDATAPWQAGGIQAYWDGEADQKNASKAQLSDAKIKAGKLIALVPLTDELAEDATMLVEHVSARAPEVIAAAVNLAIVRGDGVGKPLGIANAPGTVVVSKENSQIADTFTAANARAMYRAVFPAARKAGTWIVHPDLEAEVQQLPYPVYQPATDAAPFGLLLGRPIFVTEGAALLGDKGDIVFGDLRNYVTAVKMLRRSVSIHLWFEHDITAFRFVLRIGGQPISDKQLARRDVGAAAQGLFSTLEART